MQEIRYFQNILPFKKRVIVIAFQFIAGILWSAPYGNPSFPHLLEAGFFIPSDAHVNIRTGYEGDFVLYLPLKEGGVTGSVDKYTQTVNSGTLTVDVLERLELFGVFGSSRICTQWRFTNRHDEILNVQLETPHSFLWSLGGRVIFFEKGKWDLGLMGRYSTSHSHLRWATVDGATVSVSGSRYAFREWQLGLAASYHIDLFTPYLGVNYLNTRMKIDLPSTEIAKEGSNVNLTNKVPIGLYLGCTLSTKKYFLLNVEARLISEEAVAISGDFRF